MDCYKLIDGALQLVDDPMVPFENDAKDFAEVISLAGYTTRLCSSQFTEDVGSEITIYATEDVSKPRFYIDVMGSYQSISTLVADDFPALLATLKELQPLISLIGLEQRARIHIDQEFRSKN